MTDLDAERLSDILSMAIAKLMDKQPIAPPLRPQFWTELRYLIRDEARSFSPHERSGEP